MHAPLNALDLLAPLPTPAEMAAWDASAIRDYHLPGALLMENASRAAMEVLHREFGPLADARALCLAGPGNNGGDAIAMARHLANAGAEPVLVLSKPQDAYKGEAGQHLRMARSQGIRPVPAARLKAGAFPPYDIIIDGLLGTGLSGPLRDNARKLVQLVNQLGHTGRKPAFVLAVDIPSGLNGLTGQPMPDAVRAHATVTFQAPKLGMLQPGAAEFLGKLRVADIGLPRQLEHALPTSHRRMGDGLFVLLAPPPPDLHKGTAGRVLVVGGSGGLTGAPLLAAMGALRAGSGLTSIACPGALANMVKANVPDIMLIPLDDGDRWTPAMAENLKTRLETCDALVLGPGLGCDFESAVAVRLILAAERPPVVLDADGLNCAAQSRRVLESLSGHDVITPHPGEAARLLDTEISEVQADRTAAALALAKKTAAVVVLKGAATLVAQRGKPVAVCPAHAPALAVGGTGDVLAGVTAAQIARRHHTLDAYSAACLVVHWHARAGEFLCKRHPRRGNTAMDVAAALPRIPRCPCKETA